MVRSFSANLNSFTGRIPTQLGRWTGLTAGFQIRQNSFTGSIPTQFGLWTNFVGTYTTSDGEEKTTTTYGFRIGFNSLSGAIPRYSMDNLMKDGVHEG